MFSDSPIYFTVLLVRDSVLFMFRYYGEKHFLQLAVTTQIYFRNIRDFFVCSVLTYNINVHVKEAGLRGGGGGK
jgi:hypothetical protein